jgi:hypothetical protein
MAIRCKAFFGGLEVQVSMSMTRSPGVAPDIGQIVFRQGSALPSSFIGDLVLTNGDTPVVTFAGCMLISPREQYDQNRNIVYKIADRRWRWKTPTLNGEYNVRDDANLLIAGTEKNAQELALLALQALHAPTGGSFDVSALPIDAQLAPHVIWKYESAAAILDRICSLFGCSVHLMNDNSVRIITDNTGSVPDNTGLMLPVESGLITNIAPDYVSAYAGDTLFDSWLVTEDIGLEIGGAVKPINMLSYAPAEGWTIGDPSHGYTSTLTTRLRGTMPEEEIDKIASLANQTIYRMLRVVGFPKGQLFFPGFTLEASVAAIGNLPGQGDPSKVYVIANARTVIWTGTEYVGITAKNTHSTLWALIDPFLIANPNANPVINSGTQSAMDAARKAAGQPHYVIIPPGVTAIDTKLMLPLMTTRIESGLDELGRRKRKPAEICGKFKEDDFRLRNRVTTKLAVWKHGFRIDGTKGHVILNKPAYQFETGIKPAELYVRCAYGFRAKPYGTRYHRRFDKATGNNLNVANAVVNRSDVSEYRVQNYGSDYNDLSILDPVINNTAAIDAILDASATEFMKQYQNFPAPQKKTYTPFRAIDTSGVTHQVSYSGVLEVGKTMVSIGGSFDPTQPPAKLKRLQEQQRERAEFALQDFRAQQAIIEIIPQQNPIDISAQGIA